MEESMSDLEMGEEIPSFFFLTKIHQRSSLAKGFRIRFFLVTARFASFSFADIDFSRGRA